MNLETLIQQIANELVERDFKLATAESCTGGGVSYWLTSIPGSSEWFECGFVTYSNTAKEEILGVNASTVEAAGAVSEETARAMAEGALTHSRADVSLAITGIAGPGGGSDEKPVGTIWFAWSIRDQETSAEMQHFSGDRQQVREQSIEYVLKKLLALLTKP